MMNCNCNEDGNLTFEFGHSDSTDVQSLSVSDVLPFARSSTTVRRTDKEDEELAVGRQRSYPSTSGSKFSKVEGRMVEESLVDSLLGRKRSSVPASSDSSLDHQARTYLCSEVVSRTCSEQIRQPTPSRSQSRRLKASSEYLPTPRQLCRRSGRKKRVVQEAKQIETIQEHLLDLRRKMKHQVRSDSFLENVGALEQNPSFLSVSGGAQVVPGTLTPSDWTLSVGNSSMDHLYTPQFSRPTKRSVEAEQTVLWDHEIPAWEPPVERHYQPSDVGEHSSFPIDELQFEVPSSHHLPVYHPPASVPYEPWIQGIFQSQRMPSTSQEGSRLRGRDLSCHRERGAGHYSERRETRPWSMIGQAKGYSEE